MKFRPSGFSFLLVGWFLILAGWVRAQDTIVHRYFCNLEDSVAAEGWINYDSRSSDAARPDQHFSKTDGQHPYGIGLEIPFPPDLILRNVRLAVRGQFRITERLSNNSVVVSVMQNDSLIFWQGRNVTEKFGQVNQWNSFYETVLLPRSITKGTRIKIYLWNEDGKSETWIDDLEIFLSSVELPSFLPDNQ